MNSEKESDKLATELLKGFHVQFAENQRTREQSFLKILGFLGAVVVGYAYVYKNMSTEIDAFSFVAFASIVLLFFGCAIVTVIAYSFRRDQYVNYRIRDYAKVIGDDKPIPADYNPSHIFCRRIDKLFWMPDIFLYFYFLFPVFQSIILISYVLKRQLHFSFCQPNGYDTSTVIISLMAIGLSVYIPLHFGSKLSRKWRNGKRNRNSRSNVPAPNTPHHDASSFR